MNTTQNSGLASPGDLESPETEIFGSCRARRQGTRIRRCAHVVACTALLAVALAGMFATPARAGTLDTSLWPYKMKITFSGYNKAETLTNFTALVVFSNNMNNSGFDYSRFASTNGWDLRFQNSNESSELNYEIEQWSPAGGGAGTSYVWVQVPTISSSNDCIWAYWGNTNAVASAPSYTTNGAAWDAHYMGVWHMGETNALDSTANHNNGTAVGNLTSAGKIGYGQNLSSTNHIDIPSSASLEITNQITLETWVRRNDLSVPWTKIISKKSWWTDAAGYELETGSTNNTLQITAQGDGTVNTVNLQARATNITWDTVNWHHVAATIAATNCMIYFEGRQATMVKSDVPGLRATNDALHFAGVGVNVYLNGSMDEVRISNIARSPNWLLASWLNMASNAMFVNCGQVTPTPPVLSSLGQATEVTPTSVLLSGQVTNGTPPITVYVYWGDNDGGTIKTRWNYSINLGTRTGLFSTVVSGLSADKLYYYRYYATNSAGEVWSYPAGAWQWQIRTTSSWHLVSVPVQWGADASNNLNSTLGQQLATGLAGGNDQNTGDNVWIQQGSNWTRYYLGKNGVWRDATGAQANVTIDPGQGFWVKRLTSTTQSNAFFSGMVQTYWPSITFSSNVWTVFGWPLHKQLESDGGWYNGWAFAARGGHGSYSSRTGDNMIGEYNGQQFWIYLGSDGRWYDRGTTNRANVALEPGRAYYYLHRGGGFTWWAGFTGPGPI